MVDLLSRAGFLDEAHRLVESMPMKPNDAVWGALLGGCRIHKNASLLPMLLKNWWQDVALVRQKMVEIGVRKPAGRSWVQINGVVHDFVAGDWTHKHASSIYEMLSKITRQAKLEGYKLDIAEFLVSYPGCNLSTASTCMILASGLVILFPITVQMIYSKNTGDAKESLSGLQKQLFFFYYSFIIDNGPSLSALFLVFFKLPTRSVGVGAAGVACSYGC
ncbi:Pentatricopeptide repeat-containing protein [Vitis vinifera]|uniref:Pentatricopeptide repeat-containing protein n=1 Tax=Vitis vinifera TaxID=29760 RepID=A0A438BUX0_VITVI|nr:Pentatricopeptide repeat-containing protein [Vitis vinifera]